MDKKKSNRRALHALLGAVLLQAATAHAQSRMLLDAVQMQRSEALTLAQQELLACEPADRRGLEPDAGSPPCDRRRLSLLTGYLMLAAGDPAAAAAQLASQPAPQHLAAYHGWYLGEALAWSKQGAKAIEVWQKARPVAPPALAQRIDARIGEVWLSLGAFAKALALLDAAMKSMPGPELLYQRGIAAGLAKDHGRALADLRHLILRFPTHPHAELALSWLARRKLPLTLTFEEELWQARARIDGGEAEAALAQLNALKEPPAKGKAKKPHKFWRALFTAHALFALGREQEAFEQLDIAQGGPEPIAAEAMNLRAKRALRAGDHRAAQRLFTALDQKFPRSPFADDGAYLSAWISLQLGEFGAAAKAFEAFETRHPTSRRRDEARWFRGYSLFKDSQLTASRAVLRSVVTDFPQSPLVPQARYWAARALALTAATGAPPPQQAIDDYRLVAKIHAGTFYALLASERLRELNEVPPPAFTSAPVTPAMKPVPSLTLAQALAATGLLRDAAEEARRVALGTRDASEAISLGHAFLAMGDFGAAHGLAARLLWGQVYAGQTPEAVGLMYPRAYQDAVELFSNRVKIDPYFAWAIMRRESGFRPDVVSSADARGLMQMIPPTARAVAKELKVDPPAPDDLYNPNLNLRFGTWYISALWERFGHPALVAAAYNAGPTPVLRWASERGDLPLDQWVEEISIKETRGYVKQVVADFYVYRALYGEPLTRLSFVLPTPKAIGVGF